MFGLWGYKDEIKRLKRKIQKLEAKDRQYVDMDDNGESVGIYIYDDNSIAIQADSKDYIQIFKKESIESIRDFLNKHFPESGDTK
jgi:hypothetical protein